MNQLLSGLWQMQAAAAASTPAPAPTPQKPAHSGPIFEAPPSPMMTPRKAHAGSNGFFGTPYARPPDQLYTCSPAERRPSAYRDERLVGNSPAIRHTPHCVDNVTNFPGSAQSLSCRENNNNNNNSRFEAQLQATPVRAVPADNPHSMPAPPSSRRCLGLPLGTVSSPVISNQQNIMQSGGGYDFQCRRLVDGCFGGDVPGSPATGMYGRTGGASTPSASAGIRFNGYEEATDGNRAFQVEYGDCREQWTSAIPLTPDSQ